MSRDGTHTEPEARTLLEQYIRDQHMTLEEFTEHVERFARDHGEPGTLSTRHLQRLIAGKREGGRPLRLRPATTRLLERLTGQPIDVLLSALPAQDGNDLVADSDLPCASNDEIAALELVRRAGASDVSRETLTQLELVVDDLACRYPLADLESLLNDLRQHLSYVTALMDKRTKLSEHRRLIVVAAWLSLLAATVHVDLRQEQAARARLRTAFSLARHAEHSEIQAWCYETEAWRVLTNGDYLRALEFSRAAQALAPSRSSIAIQSIAQQGRALARLSRLTEMHRAIDRIHGLVSPMAQPDRPEHHYRYDPNKVVSYTATTLAWGGDPAGEEYARELIARLAPTERGGPWPRRAASARLDLALILTASGQHDEACDAAKKAVLSGRVVPSNRWRVAEVMKSIEANDTRLANELREACNDTFPRGDHGLAGAGSGPA